MKDEENEFVIFEDRVGVIIRATNIDIKEKIKDAKQLLKSIGKSGIKVVEEVETTLTSIDINKIATRMGISEVKLNELFDISQDNIYLIGEVSGSAANEKVLNASLMVLTLYNHIFNRGMKTTELREVLKNAGLPLENLGTILKEAKNYVIRIGKPKSPNMEYRLTQRGKREGLKLIFDHIGIKTEDKTEEILVVKDEAITK